MQIENFEDDLLGLRKFAERLEAFIGVEHNFVEGSLVVALSSKFGTGKTTFLKMWMDKLATDEGDQKFLVVGLNAWESDYYGDPLFAIISALIEKLELSSNKRFAERIKSAAKDLGWILTSVGNQIVAGATSVDFLDAGDIAQKKKDKREGSVSLVPNTFLKFQERKNAMKKLKEVLIEFIQETEPKVLFLVDELDRCRPDYAITYLETIKHIFDLEKATFVLAADRDQLESSAKLAFGQGLDFDEYYRKFIDREVKLPSVSKEGYQRLMQSYANYFFRKEGVRECFADFDRSRQEGIFKLILGTRLSPRQVKEVFRTLGHVFAIGSDNRPGSLRWCITAGTLFMAVLRISNPSEYKLIAEGSFEPDQARQFLVKVMGEHYVDWWFTLLLTGDVFEGVDEDMWEKTLTDMGMNQGINYQWRDGWGFIQGNRFKEIHETIEHVAQWG